MSRKALIAAGVGVAVALVAAFVIGYLNGPEHEVEKVRVETKTVTVTEYKDRIVEQKVQGPVRVRTRVVEKPGAERVIEKWIERGPVSTSTTHDAAGSTTAQAASTAESAKETTRARPNWHVTAAAGWDKLSLAAPHVWEGRVERRVLGPFWLGVWGSTERTGGLSLGLEF